MMGGPPIPVLGIPTYNRFDLLKRCLASIDYPVDKLVVVDNSPQGEARWHIPRAKGVNLIVHPNAGVAASWNEIIKLFPAPWWMLVNDDIAFSPGDLVKMVRYMAEHHERIGCAYGNHGASWWSVTALGISKVGLFDENIYPAYLEDCDWSYRADLIGVPRVCDVPNVHARHGDEHLNGSCTARSDKRVRDNCHRTHSGNFEYYREKWGGNNEKETFKHPFNNPNLPVDYWKFDPARRAAQQWKL